MVIRVPDQRKAQGAYERLDDRMLVLDFQAGHPEAYVEIHTRYSPLARRVCSASCATSRTRTRRCRRR